MRICVVSIVALFALAQPAFASPESQESDSSRVSSHNPVAAKHQVARNAPTKAHRGMPAGSGYAAPVPAFAFCGTMAMPPAALREVSRGFSHYHTGIDLMAPMNSPIRAAAGGTVIYAGWYYAYGNIVDIQHADGVITRYAHMAGFAPGTHAGTAVAVGDIIGTVGATGRAHGPHVHFEVRINGRPVDPKPYLGLAGCGGMPHPEPLEEAHAPEARPGPK
jgi:murein DD-endopeptidase MepM/ murein hydrolase activator NlpD